MNNRTKDIILICDDNYCLPTMVCIQSIIDNGNIINSDVCIHVCTFGLSESNIALLQELENGGVRINIDMFDQSDNKERIKRISQKSHVTSSALIKFELPNYFSHLNQVLYLDSDIIVKGYLNELLCMDISNYYVAASYEFYCHMNKLKYTLHRSVSKDFYFNSGVMLLNLKKMREDSISEQLWDYKLNRAKTTLMDQECLNAICGVKSKHLPIKWNFNPRFYKKDLIPEINKVYLSNYQTLDDLRDDVRIIHYVGKPDKPWIYKDAHMRFYWDESYNKMKNIDTLHLEERKVTAQSLYNNIYLKLKYHGIYGTFCFILYTIRKKLQ